MNRFNILILSLIILLPSTALPDEIYYYSRNPEFMDEKVIKCDVHVREYVDTFKQNMKNALITYQDGNWPELINILSEYDIYKDFRKDPYVRAISDCAADYKFSNEVNYYRELEKETLLFLMAITFDANNKKKSHEDVSEHYEYMVNYLNTIIESTNKTANK